MHLQSFSLFSLCAVHVCANMQYSKTLKKYSVSYLNPYLLDSESVLGWVGFVLIHSHEPFAFINLVPVQQY